MSLNMSKQKKKERKRKGYLIITVHNFEDDCGGDSIYGSGGSRSYLQSR